MGIAQAPAVIWPIMGCCGSARLLLARTVYRYAMKRIAAISWNGFSVGLLLFAAAVPHLDCCQPHLLSGGPKEERQEKDCPGEEQFAKDAVAHGTRRHRGGGSRDQMPGVASPILALRSRGDSWLGQVCSSDGCRGEQCLAHGCGAVLLR